MGAVGRIRDVRPVELPLITQGISGGHYTKARRIDHVRPADRLADDDQGCRAADGFAAPRR